MRFGYKPLLATNKAKMAKRSLKDPNLSSLPLTKSTPKRKSTPTQLAKEIAAQPATPPIYRALRTNDRSAPTLGVTTQAHAGAFWSTHEVLLRLGTHPSGVASLRRNLRDHAACPPLRSFPTRTTATPGPRTWLSGATKEPQQFFW